MFEKSTILAVAFTFLVVSTGLVSASSGTVGPHAADSASVADVSVTDLSEPILESIRQPTSNPIVPYKYYCTMELWRCTSLPGPTSFTSGSVIKAVVKTVVEEVVSHTAL